MRSIQPPTSLRNSRDIPGAIYLVSPWELFELETSFDPTSIIGKTLIAVCGQSDKGLSDRRFPVASVARDSLLRSGQFEIITKKNSRFLSA